GKGVLDDFRNVLRGQFGRLSRDPSCCSFGLGAPKPRELGSALDLSNDRRLLFARLPKKLEFLPPLRGFRESGMGPLRIREVLLGLSSGTGGRIDLRQDDGVRRRNKRRVFPLLESFEKRS